jgi:hypothetical protein
MAAGSEFQYTILRVVPALERGERINVGVVVFCRQLSFLAARAEIDRERLRALAPAIDPEQVAIHLEAICAVVEGRPEAGPLALLPPSERFGWLAAPSSTVIQPSAVHTGLTEDPQATLQRLFENLVLTAA